MLMTMFMPKEPSGELNCHDGAWLCVNDVYELRPTDL